MGALTAAAAGAGADLAWGPTGADGVDEAADDGAAGALDEPGAWVAPGVGVAELVLGEAELVAGGVPGAVLSARTGEAALMINRHAAASAFERRNGFPW